MLTTEKVWAEIKANILDSVRWKIEGGFDSPLIERAALSILERAKAEWQKPLRYTNDLLTGPFVSRWSIPDEEMKAQPPQVTRVVYRIHWGETGEVNTDVVAPVTWETLRNAAEYLIRQSGDTHHVFVEDFKLIDEDTLELITGS